MKGILKFFLIILTAISFNSCEECGGVDERYINIYFQDESELKNIKKEIEKLILPIDCGDETCYRFVVKLQNIRSHNSFTILPPPQFPNVGQESNLKLNTRINEDSIRLFNFGNKKLLETELVQALDSLYLELIGENTNSIVFLARKKDLFFIDSVSIVHDVNSLRDSIVTRTCRGEERLSIFWEPRLDSIPSGPIKPPHEKGGVISLGTRTPAENKDRYIELKTLARNNSLADWTEWYELAQLNAVLKESVITTWVYLNTAAKRAINENESNVILDDLNLDNSQRIFGAALTQSPKWKGLIEGLKRDDVSIVGLELGSTFKTGINGCYSITLLAPDLIESPANIYPKFRISTKSLSHNGAITLDLSLFLANENQWEEQFNVNLASGGTVSLNYNKAKTKVTIENNTISGSTFITMCVRFSQDNGADVGIGELTDKEVVDEESKMQDRDKDGFIGYLDINDSDKNKFPELKFGEANLGDNFDFRVTNGDNLDDVEYRWYINGVQEQRPYIFEDIGCYDIQLKLTHIPTGKSKEISRALHVKLPLPDLERDLNAILRVGSYTPPAVPPSSEKLKADEAEKRVLSYFASGCNHTVTNQFNQQKSINELLVADLLGAKGKIHYIKVKSIAYKNNGCNKICSFVYEIGQ